MGSSGLTWAYMGSSVRVNFHLAPSVLSIRLDKIVYFLLRETVVSDRVDIFCIILLSACSGG